METHDDHFVVDEGDTVWLSACGERGWVVVTKDLSIRRRPAELRALDMAGVHAIFLHGRNRPAEYLLHNFEAALPKIIAALRDATHPLQILVHARGRIEIVNPA